MLLIPAFFSVDLHDNGQLVRSLILQGKTPGHLQQAFVRPRIEYGYPAHDVEIVSLYTDIVGYLIDFPSTCAEHGVYDNNRYNRFKSFHFSPSYIVI